MKTYEVRDSDLLISTDKALLDVTLIHDFLSERSYWAQKVSRQNVERSIANSLCFGMYQDKKQIAFARAVTDCTTFAWLSDVFVLEEKRGQGFGKKLLSAILAHPDLQGLRRFQLGTRDAHGLYNQFGFKPLAFPERFMEIRAESSYNCGC